MKVAIKIFLIILIIILCVITFNNEIRNYILFRIAPSYAKNINFIKITKDNKELYLLGTIHSQHLITESYSLAHLQSVIEKLKPDLLLVESRPEELAKDNWGDGPIEMLFASLVGKAKEIEVQGIDWFQKENMQAGTSSDLRDDKMVSYILEKINDHKIILVLSGYSHIPEFLSRLKNTGFTETDFLSSQKEKLFTISNKTFLFPKGMSKYVLKRIEVDEELVRNEKNPDWIAALKKSIEIRKQLLMTIKKTGEITEAKIYDATNLTKKMLVTSLTETF